MDYDCTESFPFNHESNIIPFGPYSKESCQYDHIPSNMKLN